MKDSKRSRTLSSIPIFVLIVTSFMAVHVYCTQINKETVTILFDDNKDTPSPPANGYIGIVETIPGTKSKVISFKGIPYASPPIGEDRYKPPIPYEENFLRAATEFPQPCLQWDFFKTQNITGSEDCLYLNLYKPYLTSTSFEENPNEQEPTYPVLVFFHGVGFLPGQSDIYNPEYLVQHDIIVITVQYRLGALGFLSTGDRLQPGNMGLLDQVEALRWVQSKIRYFGGDPAKVTLFGHSGGATAVSLHLISPLTKGLFRSAIIQSGSALAPYAIQKTPLSHVKRLAANLGCLDGSTESLLQCIKFSDPKEVVASDANLIAASNDDNSRKSSRTHKKPLNPGPVIQDGKFERWPNYLNEDPLLALENGRFHSDVSVVIGITRDESASAFLYTLLPRLINSTLKDPTYPERNFLKKIVKSSGFTNNTNFLRSAIKFEYFKDYNLSEVAELRDEFILLHSDFSIVAPVYRTALLLSKYNNQVYFYTFEYEGELSFSQVLTQIATINENGIRSYSNSYLDKKGASGINNNNDLRRKNRKHRQGSIFTKDSATGDVLELSPEIVEEIEQLGHNDNGSYPALPGEQDFEEFSAGLQDTQYVIHGEELLYLFQFRNPTTNSIVPIDDEEGKQVRDIMTTLWSNVAKFGTPTVANQTTSPYIVPWKPFSKDGPYTLKITDKTSLMISYRYRKMLFWSYYLPILEQIESTCP